MRLLISVICWTLSRLDVLLNTNKS